MSFWLVVISLAPVSLSPSPSQLYYLPAPTTPPAYTSLEVVLVVLLQTHLQKHPNALQELVSAFSTAVGTSTAADSQRGGSEQQRGFRTTALSGPSENIRRALRLKQQAEDNRKKLVQVYCSGMMLFSSFFCSSFIRNYNVLTDQSTPKSFVCVTSSDLTVRHS